ncbi:MAG: hypothetical protein WC934_12595 [Acidithiobacillus sp.]|jgi:hypothetical protein|uniref:hypothetical protein n=1 Tax=Acidithiobacillus sp. TaxID=1872118 RepID=UPI00355D37B3
MKQDLKTAGVIKIAKNIYEEFTDFIKNPQNFAEVSKFVYNKKDIQKVIDKADKIRLPDLVLDLLDEINRNKVYKLGDVTKDTAKLDKTYPKKFKSVDGIVVSTSKLSGFAKLVFTTDMQTMKDDGAVNSVNAKFYVFDEDGPIAESNNFKDAVEIAISKL